MEPLSNDHDLYRVYLHCLDGQGRELGEPVDSTYRIHLVSGPNDDGEQFDAFASGNCTFGPKSSFCDVGSIDRQGLAKALQPNGSLLMVAELEYFAPCADDVAAIDDERGLHSNWLGAIGKLLESGDYSDCTLMIGGEKLKAHRVMLSAMSPVFGKMFANDLQEAKSGIVRIEDPQWLLKDTSAKPYKALLSYAYKGRVDWSTHCDCKESVLVLACKYLVNDLKNHIERLLAREITVKNFTELALLAQTHSCEHLKQVCVDFLSHSSNFRRVLSSPQWVALMKSNVDVACEFQRLVHDGKEVHTM